MIFKRISSFTILEMLIVMIISTITIAIAYKSYEVFSGLFLKYKKQGDRISRITWFDHCIHKDLRECQYVLSNTDGFSCFFDQTKVKYEIHPDYIIRKGNIIDTIFIRSVENKYYSFQDLNEFPGQLIDRVYLNMVSEEDTLVLYYKKDYSAETLMKNNSTNLYDN